MRVPPHIEFSAFAVVVVTTDKASSNTAANNRFVTALRLRTLSVREMIALFTAGPDNYEFIPVSGKSRYFFVLENVGTSRAEWSRWNVNLELAVAPAGA
jgi:hypothetical protein